MTLDARIARLSTGLSARERVVLYVRAVLEDRPLDPSIRATMPDWQVPEANRLVGLANGIVHALLPQALILQADVEALSLRYQVLLMLAAWGRERTELRSALSLLAVVPIRQAEYDRLVREGRGEYLSLSEAAELLEVLDQRADGPTTEAGYRRELRHCVQDGSLRTRGSGQAVEIEAGSIYDHVGAAFEPVPTGGWRYELLPDEAYEAACFRVLLTSAALDESDLPDTGPGLPPLPLTSASAATAGPTNVADAARDRLARRVRDDAGSCWARLLAIEAVTAEAVEALEDDAVVPEAMTSLLARARLGLEDLYASGAQLLELGAFPDMDSELAELLRHRLLRMQTVQL